MIKKTVKVALLVAILAAAGVGFVLSQILLERNITGTVTIASQPDLYVLGTDGKALSTIDFGSLSNGVHLTAVIKLWNCGNTPLTISIERTDSSTGISSLVKRQDGSTYDNSSPTTLSAGANIVLTLEIWNPSSLAAGAYPLAFKVTGS